ncbi:hypothetical protein CHS0354_006769 [Potamilus streckersoni]|uniref:Uncharacterized protein n=1 Tax=Potamilus streckersoni TaxID=2493646 RepID=A0AAE0S887_9BIVA|nr:hypothetical protein CHS0354_006769 [Potamilus streckersoni]
MERKCIHMDPHTESKKIVLVHRGRRLTTRPAVVEYNGTFPGLASPHATPGNSKDLVSIFTDPTLCNDRNKGQTDKPQIIYEKLKKKYDEVARPTEMQKIHDKIYDKTKGHTTVHRKTVADRIQKLENVITRSHQFVKFLIGLMEKRHAFYCMTIAVN